MNPTEFATKIRQKYPGAYDSLSDDELTQKVVAKYPVYASQLKPVAPVTPTPSGGTLLTPLKEGVEGLKTLYGGGEEGIAMKLKRDIEAGAADIQKGMTEGDDFSIAGVGNVIKGVAKAGGRVAGDVAGTIFAPIGAAIGATGIGKVFDKIGEASQSGGDENLFNMITNIPAVQEFAIKHPNAGEDFGRILNLLFAKQEKGTIEPKTVITRTSEQIKAIPNPVEAINNLRPTAEQIATERQVKLNKGFEEQNVRLKTADKSFNDNTIIRNTEKLGADGKPVQETITPIDTFSKYGISPNIEKGSIQMGDYKTGTGELGKIKRGVEGLDGEIDTKLVNSGQKVSVEQLKAEAISRAESNPDFKQSGTVGTNVKKIESRFEDYKKSYGDEIDVAEINNIRKTANRDWKEETADVSRIVGDVARDVVYNITPDKVVRSLLRQQGELLAARKYAERINGTKVVGGRLGTMALRTTGAIIGSTVPKLPIVGPIIGAVGGEFASRALQQSQFRSAWTELRALIQRSNNSQQTPNATKIPSKSNMNK